MERRRSNESTGPSMGASAGGRRRGPRILTASLALSTAALMIVLSGCAMVLTVDDALTGGDAPEPGPTGDVVDPNLDAALLPYYEQELEWGSCGSGVPSDRECATASAPMDWSEPGAHPDVELALVRTRATSGAAQGSLFTNPGGPGASGFDLVAQSADQMFSPDLLANYDIVGWDPRGVGRSSAVECRDDAGLDDYFYGVPDPKPTTDDEIIAFYEESARGFGEDCAKNTGDLLGHVDTRSTVNDLDMLRALVGDARLNYFGFSYGTDIGAQYIDRFAGNVGRIVLDGATDPTLSSLEVSLQQQESFANATRSYLEDCLTSSSCPFSGSVDDAIAQIDDIYTDVNDHAYRNVDGREVTESVIDTAISATMYSEQSWPALTQGFTAWIDGSDPSVFFQLADYYYGRDANGHYESNMFEAFFAINCLDYPRVTDEAELRDYNRRLNETKLFGSPVPEGLGDIPCDQWPVEPTDPVAGTPVTGAGAAPVLVVGTTGDPATPYTWAQSLAGQLESATLLTFEGEGHIAYTQGDACVQGDVDGYLLDGTVPQEGSRC